MCVVCIYSEKLFRYSKICDLIVIFGIFLLHFKVIESESELQQHVGELEMQLRDFSSELDVLISNL